ncbi:hypothetical protein ACNKHU_02105 [Shigella flexneri]
MMDEQPLEGAVREKALAIRPTPADGRRLMQQLHPCRKLNHADAIAQ